MKRFQRELRVLCGPVRHSRCADGQRRPTCFERAIASRGAAILRQQDKRRVSKQPYYIDIWKRIIAKFIYLTLRFPQTPSSPGKLTLPDWRRSPMESNPAVRRCQL